MLRQAPALLPGVVLLIATATYSMLLPRLTAGINDSERSRRSASASSSTGDASSASCGTGSTNASISGGSSSSNSKGASGSGALTASTSRKSKGSKPAAAGSSETAPLKAWEVGYREHAKVPSTQKQLLQQFGCSTAAVMTAVAYMLLTETADADSIFTVKLACSWRLYTLLANQIRASAINHVELPGPSRTMEPAAAQWIFSQQQQQTVHSLLPTFPLYLAAHGPSTPAQLHIPSISSGKDALFPTSQAGEASGLARFLAETHRSWLLPEPVRHAALQEIPALVQHVGRGLLQNSAASSSSGGGSSISSSGGRRAGRGAVLTAAPGMAVINLLDCMLDVVAGISSRTDRAGLSLLNMSGGFCAIPSDIKSGLRPQHTAGIHQLLEMAVRLMPGEPFLLRRLPETLKQLVVSDSVCTSAVCASMLEDSSTATSSAGGSTPPSSGSSRSSNCMWSASAAALVC